MCCKVLVTNNFILMITLITNKVADESQYTHYNVQDVLI